jgi:aspartate/methionine/tyrosine aminotransferase
MKLRPFGLERYFAAHEFTAQRLLCCSDCESMEIGELLALEAGAAERFAGLRLGYTEAVGARELREAVAALYEDIAPHQILVHAGAEEAIFNFMNVVLSPGDHVVVHAPCYQSLAEVARGIGAVVAEWRGYAETGWALDLADLERMLTADTRLVVVNFPHNPTGWLPPVAFVRELSEMSQRHGFVVFSDEVYRGLELDDDRLPAFADITPSALSLGVMSKTYGLAGLRIGWVATRNMRLLEAMTAFKDYTTICNSAPSEFLAAIALRRCEPIIARNRWIIRDNLEHLERFFTRHADRFDWRRPKAGPIAFPGLRQGSAQNFCRGLLENTGVLLLPGSMYGNYDDRFRIGFGRRDMPQALDGLEAHLLSGARY